VRNRTRAASSTSLGSDYVDGGEPCIPRARQAGFADAPLYYGQGTAAQGSSTMNTEGKFHPTDRTAGSAESVTSTRTRNNP